MANDTFPAEADAPAALTIAALRAELGLTQEEFGARIGLANKASVSLLESGRRGQCSLRVALAIEELSDGRIDAASLCEDVRAARHGSAPVVDLADIPDTCEPSTGQSDDTSGQVTA